jgi:hypothetical protein
MRRSEAFTTQVSTPVMQIGKCKSTPLNYQSKTAIVIKITLPT